MKRIFLGLLFVITINLFIGCTDKNQTNLLEPTVDSRTTTIGTPTVSENIESEFKDNNYHPIIFATKDSEGYFSQAYVLGGSKDGQWYTYSDFDLPIDIQKEDNFEVDLVKGEEIYTFYSKNGFITSQNGKKPTLIYYGSLGESLLHVEFKPFISVTKGSVIGINGKWNALPRSPEVVDDMSYLIDLDNDGERECIRILESSFENEVGEDAKKIKITIEKEADGTLINSITIDYMYMEEELEVLFLDLNGDSKLEIITVINERTLSVNAYQFDNGLISTILDFYIGD